MSRRLIIAAIVVGLIGIFYLFFGSDCITLHGLKVCANNLRGYVQLHYLFAVVAFCAFYITSIALSMPWAAVMTLAGGYLFGMISIAYVVFSGTVGATIAFLLARYVIGDYMQKRWGRYVSVFNDEIDEHGGMYLFVIRLIPVIPFCAVNALAGLTTITWRVYFISTIFGMIPPTAIFTYAGTRLAHLSCVWDIFSWQVVLALLILMALGLLVLFIKRRWFLK